MYSFTLWYKFIQRIALLEDDILAARTITSEVESAYDSLKQDFDKFKQEYQTLQEDYNSQQQIASAIRMEATNLLDEIKNLGAKNDDLHRQTSEDADTIVRLKGEVKSTLNI